MLLSPTDDDSLYATANRPPAAGTVTVSESMSILDGSVIFSLQDTHKSMTYINIAGIGSFRPIMITY